MTDLKNMFPDRNETDDLEHILKNVSTIQIDEVPVSQTSKLFNFDSKTSFRMKLQMFACENQPRNIWEMF